VFPAGGGEVSDERFKREPDDANANGERPYLDVPPPGTRPARKQPFFQDGNRYVTSETIKAFIAEQWPETVKPKRTLARPEYWDKPPTGSGDAYEGPDEGSGDDQNV
jgi:hypothetical protein